MTTPNTDNESKHFPQRMVVWFRSGAYTELGEPAVSAPVELCVRIESGTRDTLDSEGNTIASEKDVCVDRKIPVGSIVWIGELTDPAPTSDFLQVIEYEETPDLKAVKFDRWVKLMEYSDALPEVV